MAQSFGAAALFLERRFGGQLSENESNPTVGTAAAELLGGDPERLSVAVINLSANTVWVSFRTDVSSTKGIRLNANGGSLSMNVEEDGILPTRQMFAVASGAASQVFWVTMRREAASAKEE